MELLSVAGGAFLTVVFERLLNKLEFSREMNLQNQVLIKLRQWESLSLKIGALLEDAENTQMSNSSRLVKIWLDDIRDLAYDMEDVLDEFVTDARRSNLSAKPHQASTSKLIPSCFNCFKQSDFVSDPQAISKVDDITRRLQQMENESRTLKLIRSTIQGRGGVNTASTTRVPTTSWPEPHVYGRESDKEAILQQLLNDEGGSSGGFSIVPIYGMGGVGKTTLAQLVYNEVKPESFERKAWVCVSDQIDIPSITRTVLEAVGGKCDSNDLNLLQQALNKELSNKKFLLVLDDIWNEDYSKWDSLQKPFLSGAAGSKILITTRSERVVEIMQRKNRAHRLEVLKDAECLSIFAQHALGADNFDAYPSLKEVGEKIVEKCKGLPLVAKILGGLLRGKLDHSAWEHISDSEIWELQEDKSGILPALRLSYYYLPSYLKPCFAYCTVFPKDYEFDKNELVLLWMAMGFLQQQYSEKDGHRYFDELAARAFFQRSSRDESRYVMHDLIHDLAQSVAGKTSFNLEHLQEAKKKSTVNLQKVRHLSFNPGPYDVSKKFEVLNELKSLRTLIPIAPIFHEPEFYISNTVVHDWLPKLRCLRALSLCNYAIRKLPDSIGDLKCLKYLNLSGTLIESLPESVGFLLQLQTLLLSNCHKFLKFPLTIGNLIDLHHLNIMGTNSLKEMPTGITNLKNLLILSKFMVGKANGLMRLSDLKNFQQLRGTLSILDLQNVFDVQDAREANLHNIRGLDELLLEWISDFSDSRDSSNGEMQVLNWLKPPSKLKSLKISGYGGSSFLDWVSDPSLFSNLSSMELNNCNRCTSLPSLGLLPVLKKLIVDGMAAIEVAGPEFYGQHDSFLSLEELVFKNMLNWKEWTSPAGSDGEFPHLHKLVIENCLQLSRQLPINLSSLKELNVRSCNAMLLKNMGDLTSLVNLRVEKISELTCLPESFTQSLTALESLYIQDCNDLTCLWEEGAEREQSLLPFNLKQLSLWGCRALESLPNAIMVQIDGSSSSNTSMSTLRLEELEIFGCHSLKSFPRGKLPVTLKNLQIVNCKGLEALPDADGDDNSNLSLKIQNLPCLYSPQGSCHQLPAFLKEFTVEECEWLESFPERMLQHCAGLECIRIWECKTLKSLPILNYVSNLVFLNIYRCETLQSLPNTMYQLKALQRLFMVDCPSIEFIPDGGWPPNLTGLHINGCKNLKGVPDTMYQLTSLQSLSIPGGALTMDLKNLTSLQYLNIEQKFPLDIVLPSSLTCLTIQNEENLKSIPGGLFQNLHSLEVLWINDCPKLRSLPREAFLPTLGGLFIDKCPHLKQERFEAKGDYWTLTRGIPSVTIDRKEVDR